MMTNILYRIDKQLSDFTKTEKIIADYILKNPHKIIDMTVNDLADVTNVSTASIVRFSRKMTHQGFQELKIAISRYLPEDIATNPHLELIENESVETLKNKMIGDLPLKEKRKARKAIESFVAETTEKYGV